MSQFWKEDWDRARERYIKWWKREGLILTVTAPRDRPWEEIPEPPKPATPAQMWLDPVYRARKGEYNLSRRFCGGELFPYLDVNLGPGNLATFLGSEPNFTEDTIWYDPCITDPVNHPPLKFDPTNVRFREQMAIMEEGLRISRGRFPVAFPDLIENIDILASLRGAQTLMMDMLERPDWVSEQVAVINHIFFTVFDIIYEKVKTPWGGNAFIFELWGPGKTAKVQCDASAMFSPRMFERFVAPALTEQCRWLDYSLYHLDGTQCICHLDVLLSIKELDAIEYTPQTGIPQGGDPMWYDLYRRILKAGKGVQAVGVKAEEVIPLIEAVGPNGLFIMAWTSTESEARTLVEKVERYR